MATKAVPIISLKPFFEGGEEGKQQVAQAIGDACENVGFFTIVDHGVPKDIISTVWKESRNFFDRPVEEKMAVSMQDDYPYGYTAIGVEKLEGSVDAESERPPDLKETFQVCIGSQTPGADLLAVRWPTESSAMQSAFTAYYRALETLSDTVLEAMARALKLSPNWFADKVTDHRCSLRALNYPKQDKAPEPGQLRASAHTDYGTITILRADGPGLQVLTKGGSWSDVPLREDCFVINIGDLFQRWTNDKWLSNAHRVVNPPVENASKSSCRRQSMAFFHNINMDYEVSCIDTCHDENNPPKHETLKAGEWLMRKHSQTVAGRLSNDFVTAIMEQSAANEQ